MATNLAIDDRLLDEALRVGGHKTKKATVTEALLEYTERLQDFEPDQAKIARRSADLQR